MAVIQSGICAAITFARARHQSARKPAQLLNLAPLPSAFLQPLFWHFCRCCTPPHQPAVAARCSRHFIRVCLHYVPERWSSSWFVDAGVVVVTSISHKLLPRPVTAPCLYARWQRHTPACAHCTLRGHSFHARLSNTVGPVSSIVSCLHLVCAAARVLIYYALAFALCVAVQAVCAARGGTKPGFGLGLRWYAARAAFLSPAALPTVRVRVVWFATALHGGSS
jgi:hypothetical protein